MIVMVPLVVAVLVALARENADVIAPWVVRRAARGVPTEQRTEVEREWLAADDYYESKNKPLTRILAALWLTVAAGSLRVAHLRRTTVAAGSRGLYARLVVRLRGIASSVYGFAVEAATLVGPPVPVSMAVGTSVGGAIAGTAGGPVGALVGAVFGGVWAILLRFRLKRIDNVDNPDSGELFTS